MATKQEIIDDLNTRTVKILKSFDPVDLNGGDKEYSFTCLIETEPSVFSEEDYSIRVIDEGLQSEKAGYVRKQPPGTKSDLEIGQELAVQEFGEFDFIGAVGNLYTIKIKSSGEIKAVTLNGAKNKLISTNVSV